jgi:hypothetical protein
MLRRRSVQPARAFRTFRTSLVKELEPCPNALGLQHQHRTETQRCHIEPTDLSEPGFRSFLIAHRQCRNTTCSRPAHYVRVDLDRTPPPDSPFPRRGPSSRTSMFEPAMTHPLCSACSATPRKASHPARNPPSESGGPTVRLSRPLASSSRRSL